MRASRRVVTRADNLVALRAVKRAVKSAVKSAAAMASMKAEWMAARKV